MKLFVNLDPLHPPLSGIGHYTQEMLKILLKDAKFEQICGQYQGRLYHGEDITRLMKTLAELSLQKEAHNFVQTSLIRQWLKKVPGARPAHNILKHINYQFKRQNPCLQNAIYWEPNFVLQPFNGIAVPTIHDIAYIRRPEFHLKSRIDQLTQQVPLSLQRADHVITVSETSRQDIIDYYKVAEEDISIVNPGVSAEFYPRNAEQKKSIRQKYNLPENYILSLGTLEPRKNLAGLMKAYAALPKSLRKNYPLVLVGGQGWLNEQFDQELTGLQKAGELISLGYVPQIDLPGLVSAATLMAYLSHYEGFGMPVIESLASGTAVITSRGTSMEEIAKGSAYLVSSNNLEEIVDGIETLLNNDTLRHNYIYQGLSVAQHYTWSNSASQLKESLDGLR